MKTLHLIRHAKSDWSKPGQTDFERGLNARGERDAPFMAEKFAKSSALPDVIISSPAVRAKTTAVMFHRSAGVKGEVILNEAIYEARWDDLLRIVFAFSNEWNVVAMFGHNPGFSQLSSYLTGEVIEMPTCAVVSIGFDLDDWNLITGHSGKLLKFDFPKNYL